MKNLVMIAKGFLPDDGGIERYSADLAVSYSKLCRRVYVITQSKHIAPVSRFQRCIILNVGTGSQFSLFFRMYAMWRKLSKRVRPEIVHCTTWRTSMPPALGGLDGARLVITIHGREVFVVSPIIRRLMGISFGKADVIAVVSGDIERRARAVVGKVRAKWITVWNGISFSEKALTAERAPQGDKVQIYSFCRLVERKNIRGAIEALAGLDPSLNYSYKIAGTGPMRGELQKLVHNLDLGEKVQFLGRINDEDIPQLYSQADIFLHPQIIADKGRDIEGFGLTIADAMSFGAAVIVGKAGGPSDFVVDKVTGLVVDGEQTNDIRLAIERLIVDPAQRASMSKNGRDWALRELSWDKAASKILLSVSQVCD